MEPVEVVPVDAGYVVISKDEREAADALAGAAKELRGAVAHRLRVDYESGIEYDDRMGTSSFNAEMAESAYRRARGQR